MKLLAFSIICVCLVSCGAKNPGVYRYYEGEIQGTTFHITYEWNKDLSVEIDSLLQNFNKSLNNYDNNSLVSQINYNETTKTDELFVKMFETSLDVYNKSEGAFDITIAPIINAWGFGWIKNSESIVPDSASIKELLKYVGMDKIKIQDGKIVKEFPESMIITNAIAQGLSVDYISDYMFDLGLKNFLVEIGGEVYSYGLNSRGDTWRVGVDKPILDSNTENRENQIIINLSGMAISTSGNYRKYLENGNTKYGHSVDPRTGFPASNSLLSVSVISESCMLSDAWATAFMVCGLEKSLVIAENDPSIEAYFIYEDINGKTNSSMTSGFEKYICDSY